MNDRRSERGRGRDGRSNGNRPTSRGKGRFICLEISPDNDAEGSCASRLKLQVVSVRACITIEYKMLELHTFWSRLNKRTVKAIGMLCSAPRRWTRYNLLAHPENESGHVPARSESVCHMFMLMLSIVRAVRSPPPTPTVQCR
jgi:hypothetical protein